MDAAETALVLENRRGYEILKRMIDIVGATVLLMLFSPVAAVIGLLVKLDSPGSVMFKQVRVGRYGKRFVIYKFRTMCQDAEHLQKQMEKYNEAGGAYFKMTNDPRVTRVGAILRKLSLDEIPQFINVLIGDMSLVGPRPLPVTGHEEEEWYKFKCLVPPGMTGLWQISGRSELSGEQAAELDVEYVKRRSTWLDLKILFGTVPAVIRRKGAA